MPFRSGGERGPLTYLRDQSLCLVGMVETLITVASWIRINHQIYSNITWFMIFVHQDVSYVVLNMQYKVFSISFDPGDASCVRACSKVRGWMIMDVVFHQATLIWITFFLRTATTWGMQVIEKTWKLVPNNCDIAGFLNQKVNNVKTLWFVATNLCFLPHQFDATSCWDMLGFKRSQFPFEAMLWQHSLSQGIPSRCINVFDPVIYQCTQIQHRKIHQLTCDCMWII